jgi:hypothetical protein
MKAKIATVESRLGVLAKNLKVRREGGGASWEDPCHIVTLPLGL